GGVSPVPPVRKVNPPAKGQSGSMPVDPPASGATTVEKPDWAAGTSLAEQIRLLTEQFKREQRDLLQRYQEMLKQGKDPKSDQRERMREQFRKEFIQFRAELISRQKELRDEIRKRYEDFKREHP